MPDQRHANAISSKQEHKKHRPMQMRKSSSCNFDILSHVMRLYSRDFSTTSPLMRDLERVEDLLRSAPSFGFLVLARLRTGLSSSSDSSTVNRSGDGSRHECRCPDSVREYRRLFCTFRLTSSCARPRLGSVKVILGGESCDTMAGASLRRASSRPMNDSSSSSRMVGV